jgi:gas vesicle protein
MKFFLGFLSGIMVGAVAGLLFAPTSGEELRGQIRTEADAARKKAEAEWQKQLETMNLTVDEMRGEMNAFIDQYRAAEEAGSEAESAV